MTSLLKNNTLKNSNYRGKYPKEFSTYLKIVHE